MEFKKIGDVIEYVKPLIEQYAKYPSKKNDIVEQLKPVFEANSQDWGLVIQFNKFVPYFHDSLGKKRRRALKKLLYEIDYNHYKDIDFDID